MTDYEYYEMLAFLDEQDTLTKEEIKEARIKAIKSLKKDK